MVRINSDAGAKRNATHVFISGPIADGVAAECQPGREAVITRCTFSCKSLYLNCDQLGPVGYYSDTTNTTDVERMQAVWVLLYRPMTGLIQLYLRVMSGQTVLNDNRPTRNYSKTVVHVPGHVAGPSIHNHAARQIRPLERLTLMRRYMAGVRSFRKRIFLSRSPATCWINPDDKSAGSLKIHVVLLGHKEDIFNWLPGTGSNRRPSD